MYLLFPSAAAKAVGGGAVPRALMAGKHTGGDKWGN